MLNQIKSDLFGPIAEPELHAEVAVPTPRRKARKEKAVRPDDQPFALQSLSILGEDELSPFEDEKERLELHETMLLLTCHKMIHNQMSQRELMLSLEWVLSESTDAYSFRACCAAAQEPYQRFRDMIFLRLGIEEEDVNAFTAARLASDPSWVEADLDDVTDTEYRLIKAAVH